MVKENRPKDKMHRKVRLRQILLVAGSLFVGILLISAVYSVIADPCKSAKHRNFLCQHYRLGEITGSLCQKLCNTNEITFSHCLRQESQFTVFLWHGWELKTTSDHVREAAPQHLRLHVFEKPEKGTSMAQFRDMVTAFIETKLGSDDHSGLVDRIMNMADVDNDQKVTLAEAKTIWSLLQLNDFFIALIFHDVDHIPSVHGFCGDMFATDYYPSRYLYKKDSLPLLQSIYPRYYTWYFPEWKHRAKIMMGLLEFAMDAYQHSSDGTFHLCGINEESIGYSDKYDVRITVLDHIIPDAEIQAYLVGKQCSSNSECSYSPQCTTLCDSFTKTCTPTKVYPSLYFICQVIREYTLDDAPWKVYAELKQLLEQCSNLNIATSEVEHSLLLNDLKSTIWKEISYDRVS